MREMNKLVKIYMLVIFHRMNRALAQLALPQSLLKKLGSSTHRGGLIVAKSSMIAFHPSPKDIRKRSINAFGTVLKLMLSLSFPPNRVRPKVCVIAIAKTRNRTNHVANKLPILATLAAAVLNN